MTESIILALTAVLILTSKSIRALEETNQKE